MIWDLPAWTVPAIFVVAFVESSLSEYVIHRLMHRGTLARRRHALHHKENTAQGWAGEFRDYVLPAIPFYLVAFLLSVQVGIGFAAGGVLYFAFAAYSHQVQHEHPELAFWMKRPVHYLHHRHNMTRHNFGIGFDVWDRLFGTYRAEDWEPARRPPWTAWLRIKWV